MGKTIFLYGVALAALTGVLKFIEYRFLVRDLALGFYVGIVAVLFTGLGIWAGLRLRPKRTSMGGTDFVRNEDELQRLRLSRREYEVLELIAQGLSNQEIAARLFVSLNTVKTHSSNLFMKLEVHRRTAAIRRAKELRLLP